MSKIKTHKLRWIIIIAAALLVFGGVVYSLVLLGNDKTVWGTILVFSVWTGVNGNLVYFSSAMAFSAFPKD